MNLTRFLKKLDKIAVESARKGSNAIVRLKERKVFVTSQEVEVYYYFDFKGKLYWRSIFDISLDFDDDYPFNIFPLSDEMIDVWSVQNVK